MESYKGEEQDIWWLTKRMAEATQAAIKGIMEQERMKFCEQSLDATVIGRVLDETIGTPWHLTYKSMVARLELAQRESGQNKP